MITHIVVLLGLLGMSPAREAVPHVATVSVSTIDAPSCDGTKKPDEPPKPKS